MSAGNSYHNHIRTDVLELVKPGGTLLDFGGGRGATAIAAKQAGLCERAGVCDLVDPYDDPLLDFSAQADLCDPAKIGEIGELHGPFDTVLTCDILEHFADPWAVVTAITAILKPGGSIIASIPNVRHRSVLFPLLFGNRWEYEESGILDRTHLRFFVRETAERMMSMGNLEIVEVRMRPSGSRIDRLLNKVPLQLAQTISSLQILIRSTVAASS